MTEAVSQVVANDHQESPVALFKKRTTKTKSNIRKRPAADPPAAASDSESDHFSDDGNGIRSKRQRKIGVTVASSVPAPTDPDDLQAMKFAADRSTLIQISNDATKQSNWYDENAKDALSAQNLLGKGRSRTVEESSIDNNGTYRGASSYGSFIQKNPNAPNRQVGPIKAPTNIRTITVTDFAPDVCKDYKQTGFCGFGDSCKFLHAREDYKQGWELDRDWEIGTKGKKVVGKTVASANRSANAEADEETGEDVLLENIPFACIICKEPYKNPIVTKCGHYFCEKCALARYRKNPSCAACGADTRGVFNGAKKLKELLEKKRERARKKKQSARLVSGDDGTEDSVDEVEE